MSAHRLLISLISVRSPGARARGRTGPPPLPLQPQVAVLDKPAQLPDHTEPRDAEQRPGSRSIKGVMGAGQPGLSA